MQELTREVAVPEVRSLITPVRTGDHDASRFRHRTGFCEKVHELGGRAHTDYTHSSASQKPDTGRKDQSPIKRQIFRH